MDNRPEESHQRTYIASSQVPHYKGPDQMSPNQDLLDEVVEYGQGSTNRHCPPLS